jgi:hypothetical protein
MLVLLLIRGWNRHLGGPTTDTGETPSPLEKFKLRLKRKRRRITNSAGVPAGTCICCWCNPTNSEVAGTISWP